MRTPRTDAAVDENWWFTERPSLNPEFADFARELERENARMRDALEHIRNYGMSMTKEAIVGEASRSLLPNAMMCREDHRTEPRKHDQ